MNAFFDTNVLIGYIYSFDLLNCSSKKVINWNNKNYYSYHVKLELNNVCRRKNREYDDLFREISKIIAKFNDNDLISLYDVHNKINSFKSIGKLSSNEMHVIVEMIWDELNFDENTEVFKVKSIFNDYWKHFHSKHFLYLTFCFNNMEYIPHYTELDKTVLDKIDEKSLRGNYLHDNDEKILFDVHDYLNKNYNLDLVFVSDDEDFIFAVGELIDVLSFNSYSTLNDFLNEYN